MSVANPARAPRIHGEPLACIDLGQTTVQSKEKAATVAGLEDTPQSCRCHCLDGHVCRPDDLVSALHGLAILLHSR
jgi:hypothetical protein